MRRIAVYGKGGIGKSTTTSNISAALADMGYRVLQIGCDPKADSTKNLMQGKKITSVLDAIREKGEGNITPGDVLFQGYGGVWCVEAGGPTPGIGCAGRGIITAFEKLEEIGAYEICRPDIILYDVLGDVVCGGFAMPIRGGYARNVFIVTSGEMMALYAASNIASAVKNFGKRGYAQYSGVILNSRNIENEEALVKKALEEIGGEIVSVLPRSASVQEAEAEGKTCIVPACPAVLLHFTEQGRVDFVAPVVCAVADLQGFVEQILPPGGEVQQPAEAFGRVVRTVNVDVDTTGAVRHGTLLDQCPDDLLQVGDVLILENRGHNLAAVGIVCLYDCAASAPPGSDGTVSHALPYAAFAVLGLVSLVGATCKVDTADTEVVGDDGGGCSAGNARHFNLNAEVLALNRDHLCALPLVQLCSVLVVGDGVAATVLDDLDIVHLHAPDTELLVDVPFDHRSGLCGHIHRTVIAAAALVAVKPLLLGGVCFLLCAVESILCAVVQTVELLAADDLQTLIPDGAPAVFLIGLDVVLDPANNQLYTLGA